LSAKTVGNKSIVRVNSIVRKFITRRVGLD